MTCFVSCVSSSIFARSRTLSSCSLSSSSRFSIDSPAIFFGVSSGRLGYVMREMPAAQDVRAGARTRRALPKLLHLRMRTAVEVPAEGRGEVVRVAGGIGEDVGAPIIKHAPVRVREAVGHVAVEARGARLEAI